MNSQEQQFWDRADEWYDLSEEQKALRRAIEATETPAPPPQPATPKKPKVYEPDNFVDSNPTDIWDAVADVAKGRT